MPMNQPTRGSLQKNGFATLCDLESKELGELAERLELFQLDFLAATSDLWTRKMRFTGDSLYLWSRQWEYPYHIANLGVKKGRILDAGSSITFFPFYLARQGNEVHCCDKWRPLANLFERARRSTGDAVEFSCASITKMPYADNFFDVICCLSVLEHLKPSAHTLAIQEFARVLRPAGRLILSCDISLCRDTAISIEDFSYLLRNLLDRFEPLYPLELRRPPDLLTTDNFRLHSPWRLPWRRYRLNVRNLLKFRVGHTAFRSVAVVGLTMTKPTARATRTPTG
jgi:2-polyprenyl-3-methyl-5-hydroxy-6-metoxy-1,4-benzoquinol methylase